MSATIRLLAPLALVTSAALSSAASLVQWDFAGNNPADHAENEVADGVVIAAAGTYATALAGVTVTDLVGGGSALFSNGTTGGDPVYQNEINVRTFDLGGNGTSDGWNQFSISAPTIEVTGISIDLWRNGAGAPQQMRWEVSVDGGAFAQFGATSPENNTADRTFRTHSFSGSVTGSDIVLRFAPVGPAGSTGNLHINAIEVTGTAIPEPSLALLGGLGLLSLLRRRR